MRKLILDELGRVDAETFKNQEKKPIVLLLDNIRSMANIGSLFRTADAFALEKLILCGITATPPHREIRKTALGAEDTVEWQHYPTTLEAVESYKQQGYYIIGLEQTDSSISLTEFKWPDSPLAIILGNEVDGVELEALQQCDICLEIPQFGTKHSLNVSVAGGIIAYEAARNK
jgi:tRNA G18 (ribose-2'-O)-methylase SpoU